MSAEEGFYLTCGLMMVAGLVIVLLALVISGFSENVGEYFLLLGVACFLVGPLMAAVGPR